MARPRKQIPTTSFSITTTEPVRDYLDALVATGFYGNDYTQAAAQLVTRAVETLVEGGKIKKRPPRKGGVNEKARPRTASAAPLRP